MAFWKYKSMYVVENTFRQILFVLTRNLQSLFSRISVSFSYQYGSQPLSKDKLNELS